MFEEGILNECLSELPALGRSTQQGKNVDLPVRKVEAVDTIYASALEPPAGTVYRATFSDNSTREIIVLGDPVESRNSHFEFAHFLKSGRTSDKIDDVKHLIIWGAEGNVPRHVKQAIEHYAEESDKIVSGYLTKQRLG